MVLDSPIVCRELTNPDAALLAAAGQLYERALAEDERIPWEWIERAVHERESWKPGSWCRHLILATPAGHEQNPDAVAGFLYGVFVPGLGGYVCYVGVDERYRGYGIGADLYRAAFALFQADAAMMDEPLPCVVWESRPPDIDDDVAAFENWQARCRLFDKVGGFWVEGIEVYSPNCAEDEGPPVPLQLFVKPVAQSPAAFTGERLERLARDLYGRVYQEFPGDPLFEQTFAGGVSPELRRAAAAAELAELVPA